LRVFIDSSPASLDRYAGLTGPALRAWGRIAGRHRAGSRLLISSRSDHQ
jgi:hypothetical protein